TIAAALAAAALASTDLGIALLFVAIPFFDFATLGPESAPFTAAHVLLVFTLLGWVARIVRDGRDALPRTTPLVFALATPFVAGVISLAGSLAPAATLGGTSRLLLMWLLAMLVAARGAGERRGRSMVVVLVAVACAMAVLAALQYLDPSIGVGRFATQGFSALTTLVRPSAFFLDPNFLAGYLSAAALVSLAFVVRAKRLIEAGWWSAAALVCLGGTLVTSSRSAVVGLAVGLLIVVLTAPAKRRIALIIAGVGLALAVAPFIPATVYQRAAGLLDPSSEGSLATRYLMVESSVEMLDEYAIGGTGLGAYDIVYPAYRKPGALTRILHPHQVPLAMWVEMGLPGLLAVLAIVGGIGAAWRRIARAGYQPLGTAALAAVIALVVQALFQYYLYFEYLWIFLGLLSAFSVHAQGDDRVPVTQ
ncbi:MAG: O-antigen ligase family protein, partial [Coriobacteriia bacterium]